MEYIFSFIMQETIRKECPKGICSPVNSVLTDIDSPTCPSECLDLFSFSLHFLYMF